MISLKRILTIAKNIYLCMISAGVVVLMYYCLRVEFFPTELTLSDVIFFLLVITPFSLLLFLFVFFFYSISIVMSNIILRISLFLFKKSNKSFFHSCKKTYRMAGMMKIYNALVGCFIVLLVGLLVILSGVTAGKIDVFSVLLSLITITGSIIFIPFIYSRRHVDNKTKKNSLIFIIILNIWFFFTSSGLSPVISDMGMKSIGIKRSDAMVFLQGRDLEMARYLTGNYHQVYFKCDVLFNGIGSTSLLVINNKKIIVSNDNLSLSF